MRRSDAKRQANSSLAVRLREALLRRIRPADSESGVALISAMIFMIIMAALSVVLLSTVLAQTVPSVSAQRNTKTIYAAQAGVEASLGMLRSAKAAPDAFGNVYGALSQLKCSLTGQVNGQSDGLSYQAAITYYLDDPSKTASPAKVPCNAISGLATQPNFAKVVSTGTAAPGAGSGISVNGVRALSAVYAFRVSNVNIPGGRIFNDTSTSCLEAVPGKKGGIGAGSFIKFSSASACAVTPANDITQLWTYDTDYEIKLSSSLAEGGTPLCITGPTSKKGGTQDATLQNCKLKTDSARWNQLWSWTGDYTWKGQNPDITSGNSNYYLAGPVSSRLQVREDSASGTFTPDSAVGAGAASVKTIQIVNYLEFGRCLDVTDAQITSSFMISYPCKQDPSGTGNPPGTGQLDWNHKWNYLEPIAPATSRAQTIYVFDNNGNKKCLETPAINTGVVYPRFQSCSGGALQTWTRVGATSGGYLASYWFKDSAGRCLAVAGSDDAYRGWSKIIVTTCDGSLAQKWNAPAAYTDSTVGGYQEVYGP